MVGKGIREAFPRASSDQLAMIERAYETGEPCTGSEVAGPILGSVGSVGQFFNFVFQPLRDDINLVYGLLMHAVDVTDLVTARRQVRARADELARLARALEISNRELDAFAYAASHDLRAPLRGIANLAQWIEEDLASQGMRDETREMLQLMRGRMHRMESLIEGMLAVLARRAHASAPGDGGRARAGRGDRRSPLAAGRHVDLESRPTCRCFDGAAAAPAGAA